MSSGMGLWQQLENGHNKFTYPSEAPRCEACNDTYWPIRSSDLRPFCNKCNENFGKFCRAQKKLKLLDNERKST